MTTSWNPYLVAAFEAVFRPWLKHRVEDLFVRVVADSWPPAGRVILAANHVSWWDGFLLRELHRAAVDSPLYTLMREDRVERFPYFTRMGVIPISEEPRSVLSALHHLKADPSPYWVSIFPQGRIWPSSKRPLEFRRGVEVFARELAPCTVVPVAIHFEPLTSPAPSAFIGIGSAHDVVSGEAPPDAASLQRAVEGLLDDLTDVLAAYGEDAGTAWTSNQSHAGT